MTSVTFKSNDFGAFIAPEEMSDFCWIFLHLVLVVAVQFLTISSSFSHLVGRETQEQKLRYEGAKETGRPAAQIN